MKVSIPFRFGVSAVCRRAAFSLIEIMVTVGLLSVITLGLVMVFTQTQRAFKLSMAQVDVLESGRAVTDMLARELSEMAPSHSPGCLNFYAEVDESFSDPLLQSLPGSSVPRTNIVQRFFFLTREQQKWTGIGYQVVPPYQNAGMGTLYRLSETRTHANAGGLRVAFDQAANANMPGTRTPIGSQVAEGIVHLKLQAFDQLGRPFTTTWPPSTPSWSTNVERQVTSVRLPQVAQNQVDMYFWSNAVPAALELEVAVLESEMVQRFKSIGTNNIPAQRQFLKERAAHVHLFRQRIPIRNVDPSLYQ